MRIIKEGNKETRLVKFKCEKCGCEFECNYDEFWADTSVVLTSYPPKYNVYTCCPSCHRVCHSSADVRASLTYDTMCSTTIPNKNVVFGGKKGE